MRTNLDQQEIKVWRQTRRGWGARDVTAVRALACVGCGLVTLHVTNLTKLQAEVAKHPELFRWEG